MFAFRSTFPLYCGSVRFFKIAKSHAEKLPSAAVLSNYLLEQHNECCSRKSSSIFCGKFDPPRLEATYSFFRAERPTLYLTEPTVDNTINQTHFDKKTQLHPDPVKTVSILRFIHRSLHGRSDAESFCHVNLKLTLYPAETRRRTLFAQHIYVQLNQPMWCPRQELEIAQVPKSSEGKTC